MKQNNNIGFIIDNTFIININDIEFKKFDLDNFDFIDYPIKNIKSFIYDKQIKKKHNKKNKCCYKCYYSVKNCNLCIKNKLF